MLTKDYVDQEFFINTDDYSQIENRLYDEEKSLASLIFSEFTALDEKYDSVELPRLKEFYSLDGWRRFKKDILTKSTNTETLVMLFLKRAKETNDASTSEEDAKSYWDDADEDSYPRDRFDKFEDWYETRDYYEWDGDNQRENWEMFTSENKDIYDALDQDDYFDTSYGGVIFSHRIQKQFVAINNVINELLAEIDEEIKTKLEENKYKAIVYCFEY